MRIGIDARVLMAKKYSGVSWYALQLLSALFELDHDNDYVLFYNSRRQVSLPRFDFPNVSYQGYRWPNKLFNFCLNFFSWPKLDRLIGGCDAFFAPNLHFVAWSKNCRKVVVVHDLSFLAYPDFFSWKQRLWHKLILNKRILHQADAIIADSNNTQRDLIDLLGIAAEKIKVVYPAASADTAEVSADAIRSKYGLPEKYFLFVGTIEPRKNLLGAIAAAEALPDGVKLVVAGDWGWKFRREKKAIAGDRVMMLGYVSQEDKAGLYRQAVALVYPSFYEGFGLPILEAMSLGCPVIAGNNSSQGEVLGEAGLLVDPFNVAEIQTAMELMINNSGLRSEFINRGLAQAEKFSWYQSAVQVKQIFENLGK